MRIERLVLDTNVVVSAALDDSSTAARLVDHAIDSCVLIATENTVKELVETLFRPKFDRYLSLIRREAFLSQLQRFLHIVPVVQSVKVCRDPRDDKFLEAAINGGAHVIVSGDKDLTSLHPFMGIEIISPAAYLIRVEQAE